MLVTGSARAIGHATALALLEAGHEVVATARRITSLVGLDGAHLVSLDVRDAGGVRRGRRSRRRRQQRSCGSVGAPRHQGPDAYAELWAQWEGTDDKVTGPGGRPGPELVADAVVAAIEDPATPLRVPVGADAELILGTRGQVDDEAFEATMRQALRLEW